METEAVLEGFAGLMLDGKGRVTMPARYRESLRTLCNDQLTITKNPKRCLTIFPRPAWQVFRARLLELPIQYEDWRRVWVGSASPVEIDGASRILVSPELRDWAGIESNVLLFGMGGRFDLWDKTRHEAHEAAVLAAGLPDVLRDVVL